MAAGRVASQRRLGTGWQWCWLACWLLGLPTGGCARPHQDQPIAWQQLPSGLHYAKTTTHVGPDHVSVPIHLIALHPNQFELRVVRAQDHGRVLGEAEFFRSSVGALAAVNAGYFDPQYKPLGLLVSASKTLSRLRKVDHGVFAVAGQQAFLQHAKTYTAPADLEFAIECGPRLVVAGQPLHFKPGSDRRVAIGTDPSGQIVLAATEGVLSLAEWAQWLARPTSAGGAGLSDALNLDGGSSTMMALVDGSVAVSLRSALQVPVGIVVLPRPASNTTL